MEKVKVEGEENVPETQKQIEELEELKDYLFDERFETVNLAHNRKHIILTFKDSMYVFSFETGQRLTDRIKLPFSPKAFNIHNSQFWYVDPC